MWPEYRCLDGAGVAEKRALVLCDGGASAARICAGNPVQCVGVVDSYRHHRPFYRFLENRSIE